MKMEYRQYFTVSGVAILIVALGFIGIPYPGSTDGISVFMDRTLELTPHDIVVMDSGNFKPYSHRDTKYGSFIETMKGHANSNIWFRKKIENPEPGKKDLVVEIGYALVREVDFYILKNGAIIEEQLSGNVKTRPMSSRKIKNFMLSFPFESPPGESTYVLLKVKTDGFVLSLPISFLERGEYELWSKMNGLFLAFFFGSIISMIFYSFFAYISTKQKFHFYHLALSVTFFMFVYVFNGFAFIFPLEGEFDAVIRVKTFLLATCYFIGSLFFREYLLMDKNFKNLAIIGKGVSVICFLLMIFTLFMPLNIEVYFSLSLLVISSLIGLAIIFRILRIARFQTFALAWTGCLLPVPISLLSYLGIFPSNLLADKYYFFGVIWVLIFLSKSSLAEMKQLMEEKEIIREAMIGNVHKASLNQILDTPYKMTYDTIELTATIMFVDIANFSLISKKTGAEKTLQILSDFMKSLNDIIFSHWGMIDRSLGDGVLAIFGYYESPNKNHAKNAFNAAIQIQRIGENMLKNTSYNNKNL
ncbi:MAG: hypothetical protein HQK54_09830, partial [Oligoflexales bacterium]|nr:hypothetical protein [Oligoflexales bacterium]